MKVISRDELYALLTEDKYIELDTDIKIKKSFVEKLKDVTGDSREVFPIETFSGVLDGNGYCIENPPIELITKLAGEIRNITLRFTKSVSAEDAKYILCKVNDGVIENVSFDSESQISVSGVIRENHGIIKNCNSSVSLEYTPTIGGICSKNKNCIRNCSFDGSLVGIENIGGITGRNDGEIINCTVSGELNGEDKCGGIAGRNNDQIKNCTISGLDIIDSKLYLGGVAGLNCGVVQQCSCTDKIQIDGTKYIGGIVGKNLSIIECCETEDSVELSGKFTIGGLVGRNGVDADIRNSISRTTIFGYGKIGGISGKLRGSSKIISSISRGDITSIGKNAGLLFGEIESRFANIEQCHYYGDPSNKPLIGKTNTQDCDVYNSDITENELCSLLMLDSS